jgi:CelD/BcsL family acetyltransferase involved in cellulose biosynthesis
MAPKRSVPSMSGEQPRSGGELLTTLADAEALVAEWDGLAVDASSPVAAPAWALSWWRHIAPADIQPRLVAVRDRGRLVGVAPFYVASGRRGVVEYRLMGSQFGMPVEPLALPGREQEVAAEIVRVLRACTPRPDVLTFAPIAATSPWPARVRAGWRGPVRGVVHRHRILGEPVIVLGEGSFDAWLASLGTKTRRNLRREQRLFDAAGGRTRWSTAETLRADAEAFSRLHVANWADRGWSRLAGLGARLPDWIEQLGRDLIPGGRFRMCVLEVDGAPICVDFNLIAGQQLAAVSRGWDRRYARLAPGKLATLRVVEDAYERGCRRLNLGVGEHAYKLLFANENDLVASTTIMPPSPRLPRTYAQAVPSLLRERARGAAERLLSAEQFEALRAARLRTRGGGSPRGADVRFDPRAPTEIVG